MLNYYLYTRVSRLSDGLGDNNVVLHVLTLMEVSVYSVAGSPYKCELCLVRNLSSVILVHGKISDVHYQLNKYLHVVDK